MEFEQYTIFNLFGSQGYVTQGIWGDTTITT